MIHSHMLTLEKRRYAGLAKTETLFGIIHPFRKVVVLLNIYLIYITAYWAFEVVIDALNYSPDHLLHIAAVITAIFAPLTILTRSTFKMYWESRKNET